MKSVIIGATGAVGKELVRYTLDSSEYVYVLGRYSINKIPDRENLEKIVVDFNNLSINDKIFENADVYCALGTTLKQAGSKEKQYEIDYTYIINFATLCNNKVRSFNVVSSVGADSKSKNFYLKTKGELEESLLKLNLGRVRIYRPSLLLASREDKRLLEDFFVKVAKKLVPYLKKYLGKYTPVTPNILADSMVTYAILNSSKVYYTYNDFKRVDF